MKKETNKYAIRCPFHEEKTPSCFIDKKTMTFRCFGCGKKGKLQCDDNKRSQAIRKSKYPTKEIEYKDREVIKFLAYDLEELEDHFSLMWILVTIMHWERDFSNIDVISYLIKELKKREKILLKDGEMIRAYFIGRTVQKLIKRAGVK